MGTRKYLKRGLIFERGKSGVGEDVIRDLQRDLRALGYLKKRIDGKFGSGTERAVKALQYDLMNNDGRSWGNDGDAAARVVDFNKGRIVGGDGCGRPKKGITRFYQGSKYTFEPTPYYKKADYEGVPIRKNVACDWPYAARRYNGSGINSYHYQTIILKNLMAL